MKFVKFLLAIYPQTPIINNNYILKTTLTVRFIELVFSSKREFKLYCSVYIDN